MVLTQAALKPALGGNSVQIAAMRHEVSILAKGIWKLLRGSGIIAITWRFTTSTGVITMGHPLRFSYPGAVHHVTMRCNNKEFLLDELLLRVFLELLQECSDKFSVPLYHYCLMTNHVHLLFKVPDVEVISTFMHRLGNLSARRFNAIRGRKGHFWEDRFHSTIVEEGMAMLRCMAYIDLNPIRAGMTTTPGQYQWSGHLDLRNEQEVLITMNDTYRRLGTTRASRYATYLHIVKAERRREPYSLAFALFFGSPQFTRELETRFGLSENSGQSHRIQRLSLGDGIEAVELRRGGQLHEKVKSGIPDAAPLISAAHAPIVSP